MNTSFKKTRRIVAAIALTTLATAMTASAASQQNNQLALQLGAIQLGYTTNSSWTNTPQSLANALTQGNSALAATTTNKYTTYVGTNSAATNNIPVAQSSTFRAQLYAATLAALNTPVTNTNRYATIPVSIYNSKTGRITTNKITSFGLNPKLTTPAAVVALATARIPDLAPGLISNAVASTLLVTNSAFGVVFPVWGPQPSASSVNKITSITNTQAILSLNEKTAATQLNNAAAVAKAALTAAAKAYLTGTKQWAAVPKTGPASNSVYLPNFSTKAIGPTGNPQPVDLKGLANAAAAVAANAINGLGAQNIYTNPVATNTAQLYGKTQSNVIVISKALILAAATFQKNSAAASTADSTRYVSGSLGATSLGLITQVSGSDNTEWASSPTVKLLQGVVTGAVAAVGKTSANLSAIVTGISQGFYAVYVSTHVATIGDPTLTPSQFASGTVLEHTYNNASDILAAFVNAGVTAATLAKYQITTTSIQTAFNNVASAISSATNGVWANTISGARGINLGVGTNTTPLLNGVGTPVTDTIGL